MYQRRNDGRQKTEKGQKNTQSVNRNRTPEVKHDDAIASLGDAKYLSKTRKIARHQRNIRRFKGNIRPRAHRYSYRRCRQCWSVIDSVANHRDFATLPEKLPDWLSFSTQLDCSGPLFVH